MTSIVVPANGSAAPPAAPPAAAPAFSGRTLTFVKNLWVTVANQAGSSALSAWQYAQEQALPVVQAKANEALDFLARSCGKRRRNDDLADAVSRQEQEVAAIEDFDLGIRIEQLEREANARRLAAAKRRAAAMALRPAVPLPADQIQADLALMRACAVI